MEIQTKTQPVNRGKKQNKDYWKFMFKQFQPKYLLMTHTQNKVLVCFAMKNQSL